MARVLLGGARKTVDLPDLLLEDAGVARVVTFGGILLLPPIAYVGIVLLLLASILDLLAARPASDRRAAR